MYYELYIDVFFLVNFMMDIFILLVAKKILKCPATYRNISLGAFTGAALTCAILLMQIPAGVIRFMILHGLISILMTRIGLRIRFHHGFLQAYIVMYISAFLIGGVFSCMKQYVRESVTFFSAAWISYGLAIGIWRIIILQGRTRSSSCEVLLINSERQIKIKAIIDTGNRLFDDITGKPVSIITRQIANELWKELPESGLRYIPYRTIEGNGGVLPLLMVEKVCLYQEREIWLSKVLIAICENDICKGEYEMILNPSVR